MRNASQVTVGAAIAAFLEQCEVKAALEMALSMLNWSGASWM